MNVIKRGHAAKRLLEDENINNVFSELERAFIREWRDAEDRQGRELAHAKDFGLREIQRLLVTWAQDAIIAAGEEPSTLPEPL